MPQHIIIFYTNFPPFFLKKHTCLLQAYLKPARDMLQTNLFVENQRECLQLTTTFHYLRRVSRNIRSLQKHLLNDLVLIWVQVNQQRHIYIQYTYIVGKYKIYLHELQKQAEQRAFRELFMSVSQRVQMNFMFNDNVLILCLSCNVNKVGKIVRFKQKGKKQASFLAFH